MKSYHLKSTFAVYLLAAHFCASEVLPPRVTEREVRIGTGEWAVDATLTVPPGKGPFPAVLLVQGSGMGDRDLATLVTARWKRRDDRYSDLRSCATAGLKKPEMSYLGG